MRKSRIRRGVKLAAEIRGSRVGEVRNAKNPSKVTAGRRLKGKSPRLEKTGPNDKSEKENGTGGLEKKGTVKELSASEKSNQTPSESRVLLKGGGIKAFRKKKDRRKKKNRPPRKNTSEQKGVP